jgi:hypothetical protein
MSFQKFASAEVLDVKSSSTKIREASLSKFSDYSDYRTDDDFVYVRVRAISSRVNKNHDGWPSDELAKSYRTFIGKPIFVDHHNHDPKRARGIIVDSQLHVEDDFEKAASLDPYYASAPAEHKPPTWIELLLEVDAKKFPRLAKAVITKEIDSVSMGANVERSKCSHCGNWARNPDEYCKHIVSKGAHFDIVDDHGRKTSKKSYEDCYDIGFFEISFVFDPADETALVSEIKTAMAREVLAEGNLPDGVTDADIDRHFGPGPDCVNCHGTGHCEECYGNGCEECKHSGDCASCHGTGQMSQSDYDEHVADERGDAEYERHRDSKTSSDENQHLVSEARREFNQAMSEGADRTGAIKAALISLRDLGADKDHAVSILDYALASPAELVAESSVKEAEYKYVKKHGDKWVITQKGTGKVLSEHDSEEKAKSAFRAMEMHMHSKTAAAGEYELVDTTDNDHHDTGSKEEMEQFAAERNAEEGGKRWVAKPRGYSDRHFKGYVTADRHNAPPQDTMTTSPDSVDTLRQDQLCPICGSDMEDGVCEVCNYEEPPEGFDNPDLTKAQEVDQQMQEQRDQAAAQPDGEQPPGADGQIPTPTEQAPQQGQMMSAHTTSDASTPSVITEMGNKTSADSSQNTQSGKINSQERPLLPNSKRTSDKPLNAHTIKDHSRPVESHTQGDTMDKTAHNCADCADCSDGKHCAGCDQSKESAVKTADGASAAGGATVAPDRRVDVTGVGGTSGNPEAGTEHTNVEKEVNITGPHTDTWSGDQGDSLGQQNPVTTEAFPTHSNVHEAGPSFPDHDPKKVDLLAPIAEPVGPNTQTWSGGKGDSLGQHDPVGGDDSNNVGGPMGTPLSKGSRTHLLASIRVAEMEVEVGLIGSDEKFERASELEEEETAALDARLDTLSKLKTAGLIGRPKSKRTVAARTLPNMRTASVTRESSHVNASTDTLGDAGLFM